MRTRTPFRGLIHPELWNDNCQRIIPSLKFKRECGKRFWGREKIQANETSLPNITIRNIIPFWEAPRWLGNIECSFDKLHLGNLFKKHWKQLRVGPRRLVSPCLQFKRAHPNRAFYGRWFWICIWFWIKLGRNVERRTSLEIARLVELLSRLQWLQWARMVGWLVVMVNGCCLSRWKEQVH